MKQAALALAILLWSLTGRTSCAAEPAGDVESAMRHGLELVTHAANNWQSHKTCFSCHHQTLPMLAAMEASQIGVSMD